MPPTSRPQPCLHQGATDSVSRAPTVCLQGHALLGGHVNPFLRKRRAGEPAGGAGQRASVPMGVGRGARSSRARRKKAGGRQEPGWTESSKEATAEPAPSGGRGAGRRSASGAGRPRHPRPLLRPRGAGGRAGPPAWALEGPRARRCGCVRWLTVCPVTRLSTSPSVSFPRSQGGEPGVARCRQRSGQWDSDEVGCAGARSGPGSPRKGFALTLGRSEATGKV